MTAEQSLEHIWLKRPPKSKTIDTDLKSTVQPLIIPTICKTEASSPTPPPSEPIVPVSAANVS